MPVGHVSQAEHGDEQADEVPLVPVPETEAPLVTVVAEQLEQSGCAFPLAESYLVDAMIGWMVLHARPFPPFAACCM